MKNDFDANKKEWFLPNEETLEAVGPLSLVEIKLKLENKELKIDSYIWGESLGKEQWVRIYELSFFLEKLEEYPKVAIPKIRSKGRAQQTKSVHLSFEGEGEYRQENEYRRYPRAPINAQAFIRNEDNICEIRCVDISEKGLLFELEKGDVFFDKGDEVNLTLFKHPFLGSFSIPSVVITILNKNNKKQYGVFFLRLNPQKRKKIASLVIDELKGNKKELESA